MDASEFSEIQTTPNLPGKTTQIGGFGMSGTESEREPSLHV